MTIVFSCSKHLYLHKVQVHLKGGGQIVPPCTYSSRNRDLLWVFVILP